MMVTPRRVCSSSGRRMEASRASSVVVRGSKNGGSLENAELQYFGQRLAQVRKHFPTALAIDDYLARVEIALCSHGLRGDNCIACTNLCRDESTGIFKGKIDELFGSSFNTNGLGGVLTCGCTGIGAGLSHSPVCNLGKERYVFFSFPHIGIDSEGNVGKIHRPGRAGSSSACGALIAALSQIQESGLAAQVKQPGVHDPLDPEFSILKQRLARRIRYENTDIESMDIVDMTKVAERMITNDLEYLISKAVDVKKADYAVVTGVHVHNWSNEGTDHPTLEFIAPVNAYVVINGEKTAIDIETVPALTPRQMKILASAAGDVPDMAGAFLTGSTIIETEITDPAARPQRHAVTFSPMVTNPQQTKHEVPAWATSFSKAATEEKVPDGSNMVTTSFAPRK